MGRAATQRSGPNALAKKTRTRSASARSRSASAATARARPAASAFRRAGGRTAASAQGGHRTRACVVQHAHASRLTSRTFETSGGGGDEVEADASGTGEEDGPRRVIARTRAGGCSPGRRGTPRFVFAVCNPAFSFVRFTGRTPLTVLSSLSHRSLPWPALVGWWVGRAARGRQGARTHTQSQGNSYPDPSLHVRPHRRPAHGRGGRPGGPCDGGRGGGSARRPLAALRRRDCSPAPHHRRPGPPIHWARRSLGTRLSPGAAPDQAGRPGNVHHNDCPRPFGR